MFNYNTTSPEIFTPITFGKLFRRNYINRTLNLTSRLLYSSLCALVSIVVHCKVTVVLEKDTNTVLL